jgi:AMMECR1 domain-containing protein
MWLEPRAQLQRFQAQVFSETSPRGEIVVKEGVTCGQEGRDDE